MLLLVIFMAIYYNKWRLVKADIHNLCGRAEKINDKHLTVRNKYGR